MKTLFAIFGLLMAVQAQALTDLHCTGDNGQTLTITHHPEIARVPMWSVTADVTGGEQSGLYKGTYSDASGYYDFVGPQGQPAQLQVTQPVFHGGRCGRCADVEDSQQYFAKLSSAQFELDFTCETAP